MAVLPESLAYPRAGAPRRSYMRGAQLFARMALKFAGEHYPRGAVLPVDKMSAHKHWELWQSGKADHAPRGPFDKRKPPALERKATLDELVKLTEEYGGYDEPVAPAGSRVAVVAVSPGETVHVETPSQRDQRRNKRR